jgi:membrane protease YdiL (CAAX protease family)
LALTFFGAQDAPPDPFVSSEHADGFLIFMIAGCIAVPLMEEFVVRGSCSADGRSLSSVRSDPFC